MIFKQKLVRLIVPELASPRIGTDALEDKINYRNKIRIGNTTGFRRYTECVTHATVFLVFIFFTRKNGVARTSDNNDLQKLLKYTKKRRINFTNISPKITHFVEKMKILILKFF